MSCCYFLELVVMADLTCDNTVLCALLCEDAGRPPAGTFLGAPAADAGHGYLSDTLLSSPSTQEPDMFLIADLIVHPG